MLMDRIRDSAVPSLCRQLELGNPRSWMYVKYSQFFPISLSHVDQMIFHYNLNRLFWPSEHVIFGDIISTSNELVFVTLWASPQTLFRRNRSRLVYYLHLLLRRPQDYRSTLRQLHYTLRRECLYRNPSKSFRQYDEWFKLSDRYGAQAHWIVNSNYSNQEFLGKLVGQKRSSWPACIEKFS